jgi:phosphoglucosamine mutase
MTKLFGTDGIRGEAGVFPLDAETVQVIGASLATGLSNKLGRSPVVVIGRDTRESGEWIEQALLVGLNGAGAQTRAAGVITTPGVAFLTRTLPGDAGVVISASHNPYHDNGLKVFTPTGRKLDEETERLIEQDVAERGGSGKAASSAPTLSSVANQSEELRARYLDFLTNEIGRGLSLTGLRLIVDCANGAASPLAAKLFEKLGASVTAINNTPDGKNINLHSGSLHMEGLQQAVIDQKADLGVAFDGDADRSLFVDANGGMVNGDVTLWVLSKYLKAHSQLDHNTVVATVMSNIGLELALRSENITLVRTDVGDKYVLDELIRSGSKLGGEQSGHIIFPNLSLAGDGMITTICLLRAMSESDRPLHELSEGYKTFPQILVNVEVKQKKPLAEVDAIQDAAKKIETQLGTNGRLLLRYSGTEPLARVMIEGESQEQIEMQAKELSNVIQKALGK